MDVTKIAEIVLVMLSPTLAVGAALYAPRAARSALRVVRRPQHAAPQPIGRPIEQIAADLWRLLQQHDALKRSTDVAVRSLRLRALEGAITDCALDAARALELPCPEVPARHTLPTARLRDLLGALVDAGLTMPPAVDLLAADRRP